MRRTILACLAVLVLPCLAAAQEADSLLARTEALVAKKDPAALDACKKVLRHARDRDQVDRAAKLLGQLGVDVDLTAHYGFVTRWLVAGPFDNSKGAGFHRAYPPESGVDPKAV